MVNNAIRELMIAKDYAASLEKRKMKALTDSAYTNEDRNKLYRCLVMAGDKITSLIRTGEIVLLATGAIRWADDLRPAKRLDDTRDRYDSRLDDSSHADGWYRSSPATTRTNNASPMKRTYSQASLASQSPSASDSAPQRQSALSPPSH